MVSDNIALLYYSKNLKGYNSTEPITIICRHMLLDTRIMRIISLGIPKSIRLDDFYKVYNIDNLDVKTNFIINEIDSPELQIAKSRIYKFSEGTMLIYNPSLKKYNITTLTTKDDEEDTNLDINMDTNMDTNMDSSLDTNNTIQESLINNIEVKFNQQFMYSTRKVVGTGRFNSTKTFFEMFEENNNICSTNLENIPENLIHDKVLVFNIEHPENRVISSQLRNFNTLCAVFQIKDEVIVQEQFNNIMKIEYLLDENIKNDILNAFIELGKDMVTQIQVSTFKKQVQEYNVNLHLPEIIKSFEKLEPDGITKTTININDLSFEEINTIVQNKPKDFQGYMIYGINGERSKFVNTKYKALRNLKGNKPIVIEQWNIKNLFSLYWRLVKERKVEEFIKEFDVQPTQSTQSTQSTQPTQPTNEYTYIKLFNWYLSLVNIYSLNLFKIYHNAFVKRTFEKSLIPYSMKPMCGDLHTEYKLNKLPITPLIVQKYIFEQPLNKMFWRIFLDNKSK